MLSMKQLTKVHRTMEVETIALHCVDPHVAAREFLALMRPSGGGKSTLLEIVGMLDSPSGGECVTDRVGQAIWEAS
jgi:putative ABC transport system ATP-binding protein